MSALDTLRAQREALNTEIDGLLAADIPTDPAEAQAANAVIKEKQGAREVINTRVRDLETEQSRREADAAAATALGVRNDEAGQPAYTGEEPTTYGRGSQFSYWRDLAAAHPAVGSDQEAQRRLQCHGREVVVDMKARIQHGKHAPNPFTWEMHVNPNRIDGQGGYTVPPLWLIDDLIPFLRAGRVAADLVSHNDLPSGTDSINLPKLLTGSLTAVQADGGAVSSVDITDTFVSAGVKTIAGQQDIAQQLVDQSPAGFDRVVTGDLIADYNKQLDVQVINGSGGNGFTGVLNTTGINAITFTSGSPTVPLLYVPLQQSQSQIAKLRFAPPTAFLMHPSNWYWITSQLDSQNRPLVLPTGGGSGYNPLNPVGFNNIDAVQGYTGTLAGLPVYIDANVPTTVNTNQAPIVTAKWDDLWLYEGALRSRVLTEVLSGTLQVRVQVYNYAAFLPNRLPAAISSITGTGQVVQSGF